MLAAGLLQLAIWVGLPIAALIAIAAAARRSRQAAEDGDAALAQFLGALEEAQRALDRSTGEGGPPVRQQASLLHLLSVLSSQYGQLRPRARSTYDPLISHLRGLAARQGLDWTPPEADRRRLRDDPGATGREAG